MSFPDSMQIEKYKRFVFVSVSVSWQGFRGIPYSAFCCWDQHSDQNQFWQERVYFSLQVTAHREVKPRQEFKASEAEIMEDCCLLASPLAHTKPAFSHTPGPST